MNRTLFLQEAVDKQITHIASEPLHWIFELPTYSNYKFEYAGEEFLGILQYYPKDKDHKINSLMLSIQVKLSPFTYKRYSSGFFFEEEKVIKFTQSTKT